MPSDLTHRPNICPVEFPTSFVLSVAVCSFIDSYWLITNIIGWFFISLSKQEKLKKVSPHFCWAIWEEFICLRKIIYQPSKTFLPSFFFSFPSCQLFPSVVPHPSHKRPNTLLQQKIVSKLERFVFLLIISFIFLRWCVRANNSSDTATEIYDVCIYNLPIG